ncbi:MAG: ABC transporter substrate-binding protein [Acetobacteraceae bacterium]
MVRPTPGRAAGGPPKRLRIGVLKDQSSIYADMGGPGSVVAARLALADGGLATSDWAPELLVADHQNKPDIAAAIARQWFDAEGVTAVADVTNSAVALAVNQIARDRNKVMLASGPATSDLTGTACSPNTVHWTHDTWAFANAIGKSVVQTNGKSWFFITADFAFGHALERDITKVILASGGRVLGHVVAPNDTADFSSYLLQAQSSKADVIGLANSGGDMVNSVKQAAEFGVAKAGQRLVGLLIYITDVHSIGLNYAQGLRLVSPFYWDMNDGTRAFSARFAAARGGVKPSMVQAGTYASLLHFQKAVAALGSADDGRAVIARMKEMPTEDPLFGKGTIRADGRKMHPMFLFRVKVPEEQRYPWDYYHYEATIPAEEAFRPMAEGNCPLVKA